MLKIKKIAIQNFRGISHLLEFNFKKGYQLTSIALYGKNGSGKSSIVDAWEWFYNLKISYLAREDVGEKDYPHKLSKGQNCYIDLEFDNENIQNIKCIFNCLKITQPIISGNYQLFQEFSPHPSYLRYRDLQQFIYYTKAQKYEYLARYLGFDNALKIQNDLNTYNNSLEVRINDLNRSLTDRKVKIKNIIKNYDLIDSDIIEFANIISRKHKLEIISDLYSIKIIIKKLSDLVNEDPKTKELSECKEFLRKLNSFFPISSIKKNANELDATFTDLKTDESNVKKIILITLYESGLEALKDLEDKNICPLCDGRFEGDLIEHIKSKHSVLEKIKSQKDKLVTLQNSLKSNLESILRKISEFESFEAEFIEEKIKPFSDKIKKLKTLIQKDKNILYLDLIGLEKLEFKKYSFVEAIEDIITYEKKIEDSITKRKDELEKDDSRKELADDYSNIKNLFNEYLEYSISLKNFEFMEKMKEDFVEIFEKYKEWIKAEIQSAFDKINSNVIEYFSILESDNPYLNNPQIKLISEKSKAVELEIEFVGEKLSPAYRLLSESQVNSFGLSIFLAAIKNFNSSFKFIILDDVVNSFDAFKRPRIIDLIKKHFPDFQFLILTHDKIWFDRIQRTFPQWNRLHFYGWDYSTGPKVQVSKSIFEEIEENLEKDHAISAGQSFGRYLEWILQEINQSIETPIKFKIDNQHTLIELFEPLKKRFKDKLKIKDRTHKLIELLEEFDTQTSFRNFCMHWKNVEAELTTEEINEIFEKWKQIESLIYCDECNTFSLYDNKLQSLKCRCGIVNLNDDVYFN